MTPHELLDRMERVVTLRGKLEPDKLYTNAEIRGLIDATREYHGITADEPEGR